MNAKVRERRLFSLWEDDDRAPINWRPKIDDATLNRLTAELVVFHRASHVTVHHKNGESPHVIIEHPKGLAAPREMYKKLEVLLSQKAFSYEIGPPKKA